eukprot:c19577_g1_i4.p1 GENE.c19577_g1_i4~~c19577_g1_i4.p1  ORF type:complete len:314 (-),score=60.96 c19577_g1_i4:73-1014(-)
MDDFEAWQHRTNDLIQIFVEEIGNLMAEEQQLLFEQEQLETKLDNLRSQWINLKSPTKKKNINQQVAISVKMMKLVFVDLPGSWIRGKKKSLSVELSMTNTDDIPPWKVYPSAKWRAKLSLKNASGYDLADDQLHDILESQEATLEPVEDGQILKGDFSEVRIHKVSRGFGGSFLIGARLVHPLEWVDFVDFESFPIVVSYKKKKEIDISSCYPDDELSNIKGFGPVYASNLAKIGFRTAREFSLFPLPDNAEGRKKFQQLIAQIRKAGGMREAVFESMIRKVKSRIEYLDDGCSEATDEAEHLSGTSESDYS